jgi:hypothetical protein
VCCDVAPVASAGAQGLLNVVTAACVDEQATCVVLGDSAGHLRVYDFSAGIDVSSSAAAAASFKQVRRCLWQCLAYVTDMLAVLWAHAQAGSLCA